MIWAPDTCYCVIDCGKNSPAKNGNFVKRCKIHKTTRNTTEVYQYNLQHRTRSTETDNQSETRKDNVRKATRP